MTSPVNLERLAKLNRVRETFIRMHGIEPDFEQDILLTHGHDEEKKKFIIRAFFKILVILTIIISRLVNLNKLENWQNLKEDFFKVHGFKPDAEAEFILRYEERRREMLKWTFIISSVVIVFSFILFIIIGWI